MGLYGTAAFHLRRGHDLSGAAFSPHERSRPYHISMIPILSFLINENTMGAWIYGMLQGDEVGCWLCETVYVMTSHGVLMRGYMDIYMLLWGVDCWLCTTVYVMTSHGVLMRGYTNIYMLLSGVGCWLCTTVYMS